MSWLRLSLVLVSGFIALSLAYGPGVLSSIDRPQAVQAQAIDPASILLQWWDAEDRGDVDSAVAQFASDAVYIGTMPSGNCSASTPCTEIGGIRRQIERNTAIHFCTSIHWIQVSGAVVTGEREIQSDYDYSIGVDHIVQNFMGVVSRGKITFIAGVLNLGDRETALADGLELGTEPPRAPILTPRPSCAGLLTQPELQTNVR